MRGWRRKGALPVIPGRIWPVGACGKALQRRKGMTATIPGLRHRELLWN